MNIKLKSDKPAHSAHRAESGHVVSQLELKGKWHCLEESTAEKAREKDSMNWNKKH